MAIEDFTTYTELDPNGHLAKSASRVTFASLNGDEIAYVYKDKGVAYFTGTFTCDFTLVITQQSAAPLGAVIALTNEIGDYQALITGGDSNAFLVQLATAGAIGKLQLQEIQGGNPIDSPGAYTYVAGTTYYLRLRRVMSDGAFGTLYLYIYSDAAMTNLLSTQSVAQNATSQLTYRYIYAVMSRDANLPTYTISGYVENLTIVPSSAPVVTTQAASSIASTTATGHGNVVELGSPAATQHGHIWRAGAIPTISIYDGITQKGAPASVGAFTSSMTGMTPATLYYYRSYITSSSGTYYGSSRTFTTLATVPTVETDPVTNITTVAALGHGKIVSNGGSAVTEHGVCWGTSADPTIAGSHTEDGPTDVLGGFFSSLTGLSAGTVYYVRAYATNSNGTGYGGNRSFTTYSIGLPIVTTEAVSSIEDTNAVGNGTIESDGGSSITAHGVCWSTEENPDLTDIFTDKGTGEVGAFTSAMTGLTENTQYFVKAYAINGSGEAFGEQVTFWANKGTVFPIEPITRVTTIIHRYDKRAGVYQLEMSLGDISSAVNLSYSLTAGRATAAKKQEQDVLSVIDVIVEEKMNTIQREIERKKRITDLIKKISER